MAIANSTLNPTRTSTLVTSFDPDSMTWTTPTPSTPVTVWEQTVRAVALKAQESVGQCGDRLEKAIHLALTNGVELYGDYAVVRSSTPGRTYQVNGTCSCDDATHRAPSGWCKHRLAAAIVRRAQGTMPAPQPAVPLVDFPEAPCSVNTFIMVNGHKVQLTLRDRDETRLMARLTTLLAAYPAGDAPAADPTHTVGAPTVPTTPAPTPAPTPAARPNWCQKHQAQMHLHTKGSQSWYSHRDEMNGRWCRGI